MTIYERVNFQTSVLVKKSPYGLTQNYFPNVFETSGLEHSYSLTKSGNTLVVPKPNAQILRLSFSYSGAKLWNDLLLAVRQIISTHLRISKKSYFHTKIFE